jgi:hypothetical protein
MPHWCNAGENDVRLMTLVSPERLTRLLRRMLDPEEFLGDYGIRSLSRYHRDHPYTAEIDGAPHDVSYAPAESTSGLFGGNSNWRGPVWLPINYLLVEALRTFDKYHPDEYLIEHPYGSGQRLNLSQIAADLSERLVRTFCRDSFSGHRPIYGDNARLQEDAHWRDYVLFYEYLHGDSGRGLGASHQTGWTALVAKLIDEQAQAAEQESLEQVAA